MQKILGVIFTCLFNLHTGLASSVDSLTDAATKYPYALIGNSYGILNQNDLAINGCIATPVPYSTVSNSYPYWQCFPTKNVTVSCDITEFDETEKGVLAILAFDIRSQSMDQEYVSRRAMPLKYCRELQQAWRSKTNGEEYACFSGQFISLERNALSHSELGWIFVSFKTKKGCSAYFSDDCNLKDKSKDLCWNELSEEDEKKNPSNILAPLYYWMQKEQEARVLMETKRERFQVKD